MFDNIVNNKSYSYSKKRLKYYSLVFKDAEHKIINGVNPEDVHKNLIKDVNRLQSRNSKNYWIKTKRGKNKNKIIEEVFLECLISNFESKIFWVLLESFSEGFAHRK